MRNPDPKSTNPDPNHRNAFARRSSGASPREDSYILSVKRRQGPKLARR